MVCRYCKSPIETSAPRVGLELSQGAKSVTENFGSVGCMIAWLRDTGGLPDELPPQPRNIDDALDAAVDTKKEPH